MSRHRFLPHSILILSIFILAPTQADTRNSESQPLRLNRTIKLKQAAKEEIPVRHELLKSLISGKFSYILGIGHPDTELESFLKKHFQNAMFQEGYPWIITIHGETPGEIFGIDRDRTAREDLEREVKG